VAVSSNLVWVVVRRDPRGIPRDGAPPHLANLDGRAQLRRARACGPSDSDGRSGASATKCHTRIPAITVSRKSWRAVSRSTTRIGRHSGARPRAPGSRGDGHVGRCGRRRDCQDLATLGQLRGAAPRREEAEVANPDEALRQHVQEKAPEKFPRIERQRADLAAVAIVLPPNRDGVVDHGAPVGGDVVLPPLCRVHAAAR
jgi:hypothetical protein